MATKKLSDEHTIAIIALHERGFSNPEIQRKLTKLGVEVSVTRIRQKIKAWYAKEGKRQLTKLKVPKPEETTPEAYLNWIRERFLTIALDASLSPNPNARTVEMQALAQVRSTIETEKKFTKEEGETEAEKLMKLLKPAVREADSLDKKLN